MQNDDDPKVSEGEDVKESVSLRYVMTNDKYSAHIVSNEVNARFFFQITLPSHILDQLDLSTLRTMYTRDVGAEGVEKVGDIFFVVDVKNRAGKTRRRAVFVIAAEHKTEDDPLVSIQLLGYVSALLDRMKADKDFYADEDGRLPTPYVVVFSQDSRPKEQPTRLGDVLWTLDGLEGTVPNFDYQVIYANEIPLEVVRECEPVMRTFLYLTQIANKKHTAEEDAELAATFRQILEAPPTDERLCQCAYASLNYFLRLQQKRPGMLTLSGLRKEIEKQKGEPMENAVLLFFEKEVSERCEQAREDGMQAGMQTGMQNSIYQTIYNNLQAKYGVDAVSERLQEKIDDVNYYPALEEIQLASWRTPSLEAFERELEKIINKYENEIQEIRR